MGKPLKKQKNTKALSVKAYVILYFFSGEKNVQIKKYFEILYQALY
jgi:hypothetical protein